MENVHHDRSFVSNYRVIVNSRSGQSCNLQGRRCGPRLRHSYTAESSIGPSISDRRGINLNIPRFYQVPGAHHSISISPPTAASLSADTSNLVTVTDSKDDSVAGQQERQQLLRSYSLGPLTPPHDIKGDPLAEDALAFSPADAAQDATDFAPSKEASSGGGRAVSLLPMPASHPLTQFTIPSSALRDQPWLDQALKIIIRDIESQSGPQYIEFVSQVLPNHAMDRRLVKTSELVCDHLQQNLRDLQGITITHAIAVPQSQVVEDFPKSPPTTPNFMVANGYFDEPIVVTKAANVPTYHGLPGRGQEAAGVQIQRKIMVRSVVDVSLLERYIPPTTAGEVADFFNADSLRSYLADRMSELFIGSGSLLLIFPTRSGGRTFARKYVAPILDPLLREMSILRGLDTDAAEKLGNMDSIDSLLEYEEMQKKIEALCVSMGDMSNRRRTMSLRSSYDIVHCQKAEVILDRPTWLTWFVEQEQQRMKQNLLDYHKDGGRLPLGDGGTSELTAGMLTREIIEGLQKSKNEAGNIGIEVGVFIVKRSKKVLT